MSDATRDGASGFDPGYDGRVMENRIHPRLLVRLPGEYRVESSPTWHRATVQDLSAGGATLVAPEKIPPETILRVRFTLPRDGAGQEPPLEVEALVLRTEPLSSAGGNVQYRQALHFLDLRGPRFELVRRFIFERQEGKIA